MLNLAVYGSGCIEAIGVPDVFFSADDIRYIVRNERARNDLIRVFGDGVCVGAIGRATPEGFIEDENEIEIPEDELREGDMGFYGQL